MAGSVRRGGYSLANSCLLLGLPKEERETILGERRYRSAYLKVTENTIHHANRQL